MTKVFLDKDRDKYLVEVSEHCPNGKVCAAISCLLYTLEGWLRNEELADDTLAIEKCSVEEGYALIAFNGGARTEAIFDMLRIGFLQLEASYPNTLTVIC